MEYPHIYVNEHFVKTWYIIKKKIRKDKDEPKESRGGCIERARWTERCIESFYVALDMFIMNPRYR